MPPPAASLELGLRQKAAQRLDGPDPPLPLTARLWSVAVPSQRGHGHCGAPGTRPHRRLDLRDCERLVEMLQALRASQRAGRERASGASGRRNAAQGLRAPAQGEREIKCLRRREATAIGVVRIFSALKRALPSPSPGRFGPDPRVSIDAVAAVAKTTYPASESRSAQACRAYRRCHCMARRQTPDSEEIPSRVIGLSCRARAHAKAAWPERPGGRPKVNASATNQLRYDPMIFMVIRSCRDGAKAYCHDGIAKAGLNVDPLTISVRSSPQGSVRTGFARRSTCRLISVSTSFLLKWGSHETHRHFDRRHLERGRQRQ
jgi:hypothetical protein